MVKASSRNSCRDAACRCKPLVWPQFSVACIASSRWGVWSTTRRTLLQALWFLVQVLWFRLPFFLRPSYFHSSKQNCLHTTEATACLPSTAFTRFSHPLCGEKQTDRQGYTHTSPLLHISNSESTTPTCLTYVISTLLYQDACGTKNCNTPPCRRDLWLDPPPCDEKRELNCI